MARIVQRKKDYTIGNHITIFGENSGNNANGMKFDNTNTTLRATTVQSAIEELDSRAKEAYIVLDRELWTKESETSYVQEASIISVNEEDSITVSLVEGADDKEKEAYNAINSIILKNNTIVFRTEALPDVSIHVKAVSEFSQLNMDPAADVIRFMRNFEQRFAPRVVDRLPLANAEDRGKIVVINKDSKDAVYMCLQIHDVYQWCCISNPVVSIELKVDSYGNATLVGNGYNNETGGDIPVTYDIIIDEDGNATFSNIDGMDVDTEGDGTFHNIDYVSISDSGNLTIPNSYRSEIKP